MNFPDKDLVAIEDLGYPREEARFLYLAATHSGYFQPRQYAAYTRSRGQRVQRFLEKLESRGHVTWREYLGTGGVYHLSSKTLYRRIQKLESRNHWQHSVEHIRTRLLVLDFILKNPQHEYLESEADKVAYFCAQCGFPADVLPARRHAAASGVQAAVRYFVDRFPLFLDGPAGIPSTRITLSYVDPGDTALSRFTQHLRNYCALFSSLGDFRFLYIAESPARLAQARESFEWIVARRLRVDLAEEILAYFGRRLAWERKEYGRLRTEDVELLHGAQKRFQCPEIETLYESWSAGVLDDCGARTALAQRYADARMEFLTWLAPKDEPKRGGAARLPAFPGRLFLASQPAEIRGERE